MKLEYELVRQLGRANKQFELMADGDHIMVAVSGGKDSWSMLSLLLKYRQRVPFDFSITVEFLP